jgi:hypothetical protein
VIIRAAALVGIITAFVASRVLSPLETGMPDRGLTRWLARDPLAGAGQRLIGPDSDRCTNEAGLGGAFDQHGHEVADRTAGEPLVGGMHGVLDDIRRYLRERRGQAFRHFSDRSDFIFFRHHAT